MPTAALTQFLPALRSQVSDLDEPAALFALRRAAIDFCALSEWVRVDLASLQIAPRVTRYDLTLPATEAAYSMIHSVTEVRRSDHDDTLTVRSEAWLDNRYPGWRTRTGDLAAYAVVDGFAGTFHLRPVPYTTFAKASGVITGATQASPVVIEALAHGLTTGRRIFIRNVVGMTQLNDVATGYTVTRVDDDHLSLDGVDGLLFGAYDSGGTWESHDATYEVRVATKPLPNATVVDRDLYDHWLDGIVAGARALLHRTYGKSYSDLKAAAEQDGLYKKAWRAARAQRRVGRADSDQPVRWAPRPAVRRLGARGGSRRYYDEGEES